MAEVFYSNPGSRIEPVYELREPHGAAPYLEKTGERDTQLEIEAEAAVSSLDALIARFLAGDESVLSRSQGFGADVVGAPKSLAEAYDLVRSGREFFDALDPEVAKRFAGFAEFAQLAGSDEWFNRLKPADQQVPAAGSSEPHADPAT